MDNDGEAPTPPSAGASPALPSPVEAPVIVPAEQATLPVPPEQSVPAQPIEASSPAPASGEYALISAPDQSAPSSLAEESTPAPTTEESSSSSLTGGSAPALPIEESVVSSSTDESSLGPTIEEFPVDPVGVETAPARSNAGSGLATPTQNPPSSPPLDEYSLTAEAEIEEPSSPQRDSNANAEISPSQEDAPETPIYPPLPPLPTPYAEQQRPPTRTLETSLDNVYTASAPQRWASSSEVEEPPDASGDLGPDEPLHRSEDGEQGEQHDLDDEDAEAIAEDTAVMDPDNPLMQRVQAALYKQLSEQKSKLQYDLKEKEEAVRAANLRREAIGVELYSLQQQLARHQAMLEGTQDNLNVIRGYREEAERRLRHATSQWKEQKEKLPEIPDRYRAFAFLVDQHKQELEKISRTIKQVDLYNEDLRSKILVAKRTTMKAEEDLIKQEQDKKRQDYFVDHLTDQLRKLQERRALYETQLLAQQKETKAAMETLQDAATEMEAIQFEKRQLLHQWKSSLIGLQKREEVLQQIDIGIQKNKDTILNMAGEISGFKHSLRKAQEENESLTVLLNKLEGEVDYLKREIGSINEQKEKLKESWTMYTKSLAQTEGELGTVMLERQTLQMEMSAVQKQTHITVVAKQKLQSDISEHLQAQLSISKGAQGTRKDNNRLRNQIHEKEATIAQVENDLSHIRLDTLNANSRIRGMKETLQVLDAELAERNEVIEKYEVEIRRRNDELGKKQGEMDLLNKKYDQLTAKNLDESVGPLEATIHNLSKLVQQKEKESSQLSQFWLRSQNELVVMTKRTGEVSDETQDLRMRLTVLSRKKMVVNNAFDTELKEIREHQRNIRQLQNDMVKINTLLTRQASVQNKLEENNLGLEQEFRAKLKRAELESIHMEQNLENLKAEKQRALQGLVEAERQMMLWEKKIQLARETQAALDPNVGATEIKEMQAEIHRMKLRYASMLKLQEKMVAEMEKSVYRRESITARTKTKGKGGGQISLQKAITDLTKKIRMTMNDLRECDQDIVALQSSQENLTAQVSQASNSITDLEAKEQQLLTDIETQLQKKELLANQTLLKQRQARRYRDVADGKYSFLVREADQREVERDKHKERLEKIDSVIRIVETEYGESVKSSFEPIHNLIAMGLTI
ncbi:hypothetical protein SpCBS45565_g03525 [Spizellomyces sp. 'palustris']|nr:hypothetical protein SpCBS45565_g03525 [Spizellomyces sp. 'palustris']